MAVNKVGFTPDQIVGAIEEIQAGFASYYTRYHILNLLFFFFVFLGSGQISLTTLSFLKLQNFLPNIES